MLPVYICDDELNIRTAIRAALEKQILIQGYDMSVIACTHSPEEILAAVRQQRCRGIYFLDVELKDVSMDGFSLGQAIRRLDPRGFLIYVTGFKDLAFQTFKYHLEALDYIVKENPDQMYESIRNCLDIVIHRLSEEYKDRPAYFTIRASDMIRHVLLKDILFFETAGRTHRIALHSLHEQMDFIGSLGELEKQLPDSFLRTHRAYLVNTENIAELDLKHQQIRMVNGEICLMSRTARPLVLSKV